MAEHKGPLIDAAMKVVAKSHEVHRGPGNKNLGPSRVPQSNPTGMIRAMSPGLKGPDKGAGGQ